MPSRWATFHKREKQTSHCLIAVLLNSMRLVIAVSRGEAFNRSLKATRLLDRPGQLSRPAGLSTVAAYRSSQRIPRTPFRLQSSHSSGKQLFVEPPVVPLFLQFPWTHGRIRLDGVVVSGAAPAENMSRKPRHNVSPELLQHFGHVAQDG